MSETRDDDLVERLRELRDQLHSSELRLSGTDYGNMYSRWGTTVALALIEIERLRTSPAPSVEVVIEQCAKKAEDATRAICRGDYVMGGPAVIGMQIARAIRSLSKHRGESK